MTPENNHSMIDVIIPPVPRTSQLISISLAIFPLHVHSFIRCYGSWCSISNDYNDLWLLSLSMSKCKSIPWCASPCPKLSVYWADFHVNIQHLLLLFILSKSKADIFFCAVLFHIRSWHYLLLFSLSMSIVSFLLWSLSMSNVSFLLFSLFMSNVSLLPFSLSMSNVSFLLFSLSMSNVSFLLFSLSMSNVSFHCFLYPCPIFPFCCFLYPCPMFPFTVFSIHVQRCLILLSYNSVVSFYHIRSIN